MLLLAANPHDGKLFEPLLETNPAVRGRRGWPGRLRCRPEKLQADKGDYCRRCRGVPAPARDQGADRAERDRGQGEAGLGALDRTERTTLPLLTLTYAVINVRSAANRVGLRSDREAQRHRWRPWTMPVLHFCGVLTTR